MSERIGQDQVTRRDLCIVRVLGSASNSETVSAASLRSDRGRLHSSDLFDATSKGALRTLGARSSLVARTTACVQLGSFAEGMIMFEHTGLRPLWPVILFLPWFLVGVAYLVKSMLRGENEIRPLSVRISNSPRREAWTGAPPVLGSWTGS